MKKKDHSNLPTEAQCEKHESLKPLLDSLFEEIKELSKKKPDEVLNKLKVKIINKILSQVKEFLSVMQTVEFLELLDEETLPSNSDATLMVGQFRAVRSQFKSKYYYYEDYENRWHTKENP